MNHRKYILDVFTPALNAVLFQANPQAFCDWYGSACRQTAVLIAYEMSKRMPEQTWHVFEGKFAGSPRGRQQAYDHAWVWSSGGIFIDANHRRAHRIWEESCPNAYPPKSEFARRWTEASRIELPWVSMLDDTEYYTGLPGRFVYDAVKEVISSTPEASIRSFEKTAYEVIRPEWMDA